MILARNYGWWTDFMLDQPYVSVLSLDDTLRLLEAQIDALEQGERLSALEWLLRRKQQFDDALERLRRRITLDIEKRCLETGPALASGWMQGCNAASASDVTKPGAREGNRLRFLDYNAHDQFG